MTAMVTATIHIQDDDAIAVSSIYVEHTTTASCSYCDITAGNATILLTEGAAQQLIAKLAVYAKARDAAQAQEKAA